MKMRLSPRHARLSTHAGHDYLRNKKDGEENILQRLESQILGDEQKRRQA